MEKKEILYEHDLNEEDFKKIMSMIRSGEYFNPSEILEKIDPRLKTSYDNRSFTFEKKKEMESELSNRINNFEF
jgi:hypothetical protein